MDRVLQPAAAHLQERPVRGGQGQARPGFQQGESGQVEGGEGACDQAAPVPAGGF
ncbi:hypothetical protein [Streptomyces koyangensis]